MLLASSVCRHDSCPVAGRRLGPRLRDGGGLRDVTLLLPPSGSSTSPTSNASAALSADHPRDGKEVPETALPTSSARGRFSTWAFPSSPGSRRPFTRSVTGFAAIDSKCSYGVQLTDASGETHQYGKNTGQCGLIDFAGWKEIHDRPGLPARDVGRGQERQARLPAHGDHADRRPAHRSGPDPAGRGRALLRRPQR